MKALLFICAFQQLSLLHRTKCVVARNIAWGKLCVDDIYTLVYDSSEICGKSNSKTRLRQRHRASSPRRYNWTRVWRNSERIQRRTGAEKCRSIWKHFAKRFELRLLYKVVVVQTLTRWRSLHKQGGNLASKMVLPRFFSTLRNCHLFFYDFAKLPHFARF